ncbi:MAG: site-2 protease family protein [Acidobacteria bacterium]|jgi:membrane-associated protease RseP (regulator of RpoE activity)|nr:site-2 protease family protein [Acidobacteriota bacterium]
MSSGRFRTIAVPGLLFLLTLACTIVIGVQYHVSYFNVKLPAGMGFWSFLLSHPGSWLWGLSYSLPLLGILLVHELGHYFACRRHGIAATLPHFIPAPTLIGTFGAFIKIRSPFSSKRALFDVGLAGPLAGFLVALPVVAAGLSRSLVVARGAMDGGLALGEPLAFTLLGRLLLGELPAQSDLLVHPMAFAGWFGLLATAFNLFPIGQLDGGHILYAIIGGKAYYFGIAAVAALVLLGIFYWQGWLLWALIVTLIGLRHPPIFEAERLDLKRKVLAAAALLIFILSFTPAPLALAP